MAKTYEKKKQLSKSAREKKKQDSKNHDRKRESLNARLCNKKKVTIDLSSDVGNDTDGDGINTQDDSTDNGADEESSDDDIHDDLATSPTRQSVLKHLDIRYLPFVRAKASVNQAVRAGDCHPGHTMRFLIGRVPKILLIPGPCSPPKGSIHERPHGTPSTMTAKSLNSTSIQSNSIISEDWMSSKNRSITPSQIIQHIIQTTDRYVSDLPKYCVSLKSDLGHDSLQSNKHIANSELGRIRCR